MSNNYNKSYLALLTIVAALGGLLFGFDIAIITGAAPFLKAHFNLGELKFGWAVSSLLVGCIFGAALAGRITDLYGRKKILLYVALLFALTSVGTALAPSFSLFILARLFGGLAVGAASMLSPMYISEVAPSKVRGSLVSIYQFSIVFGIMVSYLINYLLHDIGPDNWRWMFATGTIPSVLFFVLLFLVPETPRFLFKAGQEEEAFQLLKRIGGQANADKEIVQIRESMKEKGGKFKDLFKPGMKRVLMVGLGLATLIQLSGINTIIDYAPIILETAGWDIDAALFSTVGIGAINIIFTFVAVLLVDRFGRKPLYLIGSAGMTVMLLVMTISQITGHFKGTLVLILILAYIAFFASCIGPVFWTLVSEIFPNKVRGTAMSIAVLAQWFFNFLVVLLFPCMLEEIGGSITFGFLGLMALLQLIFTWYYVPETKGKTLEEIEKNWQ